MIYDLSVQPGDWLAGLWWNEVPPGKLGVIPTGGYRMCLARRLAEVQGQVIPWIVEDCYRATGEATWLRGQYFLDRPLPELLDELGRRWVHLHQTQGCRGSYIEVCGDAELFQLMLENGLQLPGWMSVHIKGVYSARTPSAP